MDDQAGAGGGRLEEADVTGCQDHPAPDANCDDCLAKWNLHREIPIENRRRLLTPGALRARFRPGQSGNPKGKIARRSMQEIVNALLDQGVVIQGPDGQPETVARREAFARILLAQIIRPDPREWAVKLLLDREWPKRIGVDLQAVGDVHLHFDDQDREDWDAIRAALERRASGLNGHAPNGVAVNGHDEDS